MVQAWTRSAIAFLTLENYVDQPRLVVVVSECDVGVLLPCIEVTKTSFQASEEKSVPVLDLFAVLVCRRAPFVRNLRQARGSDFWPGQFA